MNNSPRSLDMNDGEGALVAPLRPIGDVGARKPLFVVHGFASDFSLLAAQIAATMPVCELHATPQGETRLRTIEEMAARCVKRLREVQPEGPYRLAGWSLDGILAYEVAVQLVGHDQRVEFLGLLEAPAPRTFHRIAAFDGLSWKTMRYWADVAESEAFKNYAAFPAAIPSCLFLAKENSADGHGWEDLIPGSALRRIEAAGDLPLGQAIKEAASRNVAVQEFRHRPLISIQTGSKSETPAFCIPGAGEGVTSMLHFADTIGVSRTVYGLQPRGLDENQIPHATVEAAAASYLRAIEEARQKEPIHLIGHSFGGWVAFEMALMLQSAGRPVASLMLIDSRAPCSEPSLLHSLTRHDVLSELIDALELSSGRAIALDRDVLAHSSDKVQLEMLHGAMIQAGMIHPRSRSDALRGVLRTFGTALRTVYKPSGIFAEQMHLVLSPDPKVDTAANEKEFEDRILAWKEVSPNITHWIGPGNHFTILKSPFVDKLSERWNKYCSSRSG